MEDLILFVIGYVMIGYALGSIMAVFIAITLFFLKGRRADVHTL